MRKISTRSLLTFMLPLLAVLAFSSCTFEDDDPYEGSSSLVGTWYNADNPSEYYEFYPDGTGYWWSNGMYTEIDYDYSWDAGWIDISFYPIGYPPYTLQCGLSTSGYNQICITYEDEYGPYDVFYNLAR